MKEANTNLLKVNGKYYLVDREDKDGNIIFKPANKSKIDYLTKKIVPKLINSLDKEAILVGALANLSRENLEGIYNRLYTSKRKAKPKQKRGCQYIKIGKHKVLLQE